MGITESVVLGVALAMDAFAVTLSDSLGRPSPRTWAGPVLFGLFQGLMPVAGFFLGSIVGDVIERFSGVVALVVLGFIGVNMVREGLSADGYAAEGDCEDDGRSPWVRLLLEAVATSIDAFAVGVSLRAMGAPIWSTAAVIGLVTAILCLGAVALGRYAGPRLGKHAQVFGGVVLIAIGLKAFFS